MEPVPDVDYTATSSRPQWGELPPGVRAAVARAAGARVVRAEASVTSGFSGGFAAVLHLAGGRRVFAKAGSGVNPHLLDAYRREALVLAALPPAVPAPRLVGAASLAPGDADSEAWQIVVSEAVEGRMPHPWTEPALAAVHEACLAAADALDPPPATLTPVLGSLVEEYADDAVLRGVFTDLDAGRLPLTWGQPAWLPRRYAELHALLELAPAALAGTTGTHGDLRADNVLVDGRRAVVVDWNWLSLGPRWADLVGVLPLFPGGLPALRVHQRRYARAFLDWLGARRGWVR